LDKSLYNIQGKKMSQNFSAETEIHEIRFLVLSAHHHLGVHDDVDGEEDGADGRVHDRQDLAPHEDGDDADDQEAEEDGLGSM
jgi:hypothetical protein